MVEYAMFYQRAHSYTLIPDISSTFADVSRHCAQLTSFSCSWTMDAASNPLNQWKIAHPYKNPETKSVTTFMNIDKLYELATTQAHIGSSIPQGVK